MLIFGISSDIVPRPKLYDIASSIFAQKLAQVQGVGQVSVGGSSLPAVRVEVNPQPVSKYNVGLDQVGSFLQGANANRPKGEIANANTTLPLYTTDQLFEARNIKTWLPFIATGRPFACRIWAASSTETKTSATWAFPMASLRLRSRSAASRMPILSKPSTGLKLCCPSFGQIADWREHDRSILTGPSQSALRSTDAERNMVISIVLVIFVVFVFLRNWWATFIPSVSVPVSLVATFGVMYLCGYTLDNLSLMALAIATGFVVDDAIVVIENITRHIENGMQPMAAAFRGASEIGFTVLSISLSLVAVFIPILMMGGIVGRLFREFAVVLSAAIVMSMLVSLTATPMMCAAC